MTARILVTGSRDWPRPTLLRGVLALAWHAWPGAVLVNGGATGADEQAAAYWDGRGGAVQTYPAAMFTSPRVRNQHMVDLGATACLTFANAWASGTGMCARMARRARIPTYDYGAPTTPLAAHQNPAPDGPTGPWGTCPHCHKPIPLTDAYSATQAAESAEDAAAYHGRGPA